MTLFSLALLLFLSSTATLVSSAPLPTIADLISGTTSTLPDSRLAYFKKLVNATDPGLLAILADTSKNFTVLAPLNNMEYELLSMDSYQANRTAFYHVIEGQKIKRSQFVTQSYCPVLYGVALDVVTWTIKTTKIIEVSYGGGRRAKMQSYFKEASNGMIHWVDSTLKPIESPCWTTGEFLSQCCNRTATPPQIMQPPTTPPTSKPTNKPTSQPTNKPTSKPTPFPTKSPTSSIGLISLVSTDTDPPTDQPTKEPTDQPTEEPTKKIKKRKL